MEDKSATEGRERLEPKFLEALGEISGVVSEGKRDRAEGSQTLTQQDILTDTDPRLRRSDVEDEEESDRKYII